MGATWAIEGMKEVGLLKGSEETGLAGGRGRPLGETDCVNHHDIVEATGNQGERLSLKWRVSTEGFWAAEWYDDNDFSRVCIW